MATSSAPLNPIVEASTTGSSVYGVKNGCIRNNVIGNRGNYCYKTVYVGDPALSIPPLTVYAMEEMMRKYAREHGCSWPEVFRTMVVQNGRLVRRTQNKGSTYEDEDETTKTSN